MSPTVLQEWHKIVKHKDATGLESLLADNVVFHSPIVHTPQPGKEITKKYLTAAIHVLSDDSFKYVREIIGNREAMLEFEVELDGIVVNGIDIIKWNENNKIVDFKVMIRPFKAVNLIHQKMMQVLQAQQRDD